MEIVAYHQTEQTATKILFFSAPTSLCKVTDTPDVCQMKKTQCGFITKALSPPGGYVRVFVNCAKDAGIALGPFFFTSIG